MTGFAARLTHVTHAYGAIHALDDVTLELPAGKMVDYKPLTPTLGNLIALCPVCECVMQRRVSTARLPAVAALVFGGLSVYLMSLSLSVIPIGTAYAVWTGIGAVGAFVVGILLFGDQASTMRIVSIALITARMPATAMGPFLPISSASANAT